ncbi:CU044_2847 family protein [Streptomyces sp. NPDC048370]|uniref:CU044_2847 family protein n=1 Tax=Streptomyces sp. NPDC048370 TaxID=3365540 RepID=UPI00371C0F16
MSALVTINMGDGTEIRAEVVELTGPGSGGDAGLRRASGRAAEAVALKLDEVRTLIRGMGTWAADTIAGGGPGQPDTFELEFGLKLAVKSGHLVGVIAEAASEASLTVRMSWDTAARRERSEVETATPSTPSPGSPA